MKKLFRTSLFFSLLISGTVFFTTIPKESKATDVISFKYKESHFVCLHDPSQYVMRCRVGGSFCNVSNQELCPSSPM